MADTTIRAIIKLLVEGGHIPKEVATSLKDVGQVLKKDVAPGLKGATDESKKATVQLGTFGGATKDLVSMLKNLAGALGLTFAVGAIFGWLKNAYEGFAKTERSVLAVETAIRNLGQAADVAKFRPFIAELSHASGILDDDLVPAFQRALVAFKDYATASEIVTKAAQFAAAGVGDLQSNVEAMSRFFLTGSARSLVQFGINVKGGEDAVLDLNEGLRALNDALALQPKAFDDAQAQINRTKISLDEISDALGKAVFQWSKYTQIIVSSVVYDPSDTIKAINEERAAILERNKAAGIDFSSPPPKSKTPEEIEDAAIYGPIDLRAAAEIKFANEQAARDRKANEAKLIESEKAEKERLAKVADLNAKHGEALLAAQIALAKEGSQDRLALEMELLDKQEKADVADAKKIGADVNKVHEEFQLRRAATQKQFDEARAASEQAASDKLLQIQIAAAKAGSEERYLLEVESINRRYEREIAAEEALHRDTKTLRLAWERELSTMTIEFVADRAAAELEIAKQTIDAERALRDAGFAAAIELSPEHSDEWFAAQQARLHAHYEDERQALTDKMAAEEEAVTNGDLAALRRHRALLTERLALDSRYTTATKRLAQSEADYKRQAYFDAASAAIQALQAVFGKSKAFAIAQLVVDTASAVMRVWAGPGEWYEKLAKTIVIGAIAEVQRQRIHDASPGAGGSLGGSSSGANAGSAATTVSSAAEGAIVPADDGKALPAGFAPKGRDTKPFMLEPGEIVTPADVSKEILAGAAVLAAGTPGGPGRPIIGGRLSVVPIKQIGGVMRAADGAIVPPSMQIGGTKGSSALMSYIGMGAMGGAAKAAMQAEPQEAKLDKLIEVVSDLKPSGEATEPQAVDNSIHFHQPVYGGDEGGRQLVRKIDEWRRRDSNRVIR